MITVNLCVIHIRVINLTEHDSREQWGTTAGYRMNPGGELMYDLLGSVSKDKRQSLILHQHSSFEQSDKSSKGAFLFMIYHTTKHRSAHVGHGITKHLCDFLQQCTIESILDTYTFLHLSAMRELAPPFRFWIENNAFYLLFQDI